MLFVRGSEGVNTAVNFYTKALSLPLLRHTETFAELSTGPNSPVRLSIQSTDVESRLSSSYSPFLTFNVLDMDTAVATAAQLGGHLDGPVKYPAHGKVATLRAPDGHMIGLYEPYDTLGQTSGLG